MNSHPDHIAPLPSTHVDNGILGRVPSQYVAQALNSLPAPACTVDDEIRVEVDADWAGRVCLTFKKQHYRRSRAKTSYCSWLCTYAEAANGASDGPSPAAVVRRSQHR
ncbi:hypothetical protein [Pelomonas cellulosilytica]|uniref:Uncharacterized protein n=1 Tax=Pelomonas cellulosilytica TaxID=2906762 RepID=A0ABS8XW23_9BURK|nr:hypothetical protein [Pelomonas sp. P8]MCE4556856.1 hypothetical protein [Pelomonas sp. P8]